MLHSLSQALNLYSVVLASGSPRRRELLELMLPVPFRVEVSGFAEDLPKTDDPAVYVAETARQKGLEVFRRCPDSLVVAADTVVVLDGEILEKPESEADARRTLRRLSGARHEVLTGVALFRESHERTFVERTSVFFSELHDADIDAYAATGEPEDKAGSYGIQGRAGVFVERIEGDYFNVVGLPMNRLSRELASFL